MLPVADDDHVTVKTSLADGGKRIFVGEKTFFNVTVRFAREIYTDFTIYVLPTIDVPDVFPINSVKNVKVGSNLRISGSTKPVIDYRRPELQTPGNALSYEFILGTIVLVGKKFSKPEDDVVFIQYEALIPKERSEGFAEIGHNHMYAVNVRADDNFYLYFDHILVLARSLPVLFRTLREFSARKSNNVQEMVIDRVMPERTFLF